MSGTAVTSDGWEPSAVRRSWVPRTVAAFFLGAGVYAGLAVASAAVAHADEPAATPADQVGTVEAQSTDPTATGDATEPGSGDTGTTTSVIADIASIVTTTTSTITETVTGTTEATAEAVGVADVVATTSGTTTTVTTTTVTTTTEDGTVTVTTRDTATADTVGDDAAPDGATAAPEAPATTQPAGTSAPLVTPAVDAPCQAAGDPAARAGGSTDVDRPAGAYVSAAPDTTSSVTAAGSAAPALVVPATEIPGGSPFGPELPLQVPAPATAFGLGGCGGPSAGQGSPKGASSPATAGILGTSFEISLAAENAAPTAPAAGSPTLTATDPATRPD